MYMSDGYREDPARASTVGASTRAVTAHPRDERLLPGGGVHTWRPPHGAVGGPRWPCGDTRQRCTQVTLCRFVEKSFDFRIVFYVVHLCSIIILNVVIAILSRVNPVNKTKQSIFFPSLFVHWQYIPVLFLCAQRAWRSLSGTRRESLWSWCPCSASDLPSVIMRWSSCRHTRNDSS